MNTSMSLVRLLRVGLTTLLIAAILVPAAVANGDDWYRDSSRSALSLTPPDAVDRSNAGHEAVPPATPVSTPASTSSSSIRQGFDWADFGIGAGAGFAVMLVVGTTFLVVRQRRPLKSA